MYEQETSCLYVYIGGLWPELEYSGDSDTRVHVDSTYHHICGYIGRPEYVILSYL